MNTPIKEVTNNAGLRDIKNDLSILKDDAKATISDAAAIVKNVKNESGNIARDGVKQLRAVSETEFHKMEERVRERPGQSVALAFCAGLVFSYILGSRR